ncbi:hypothetical protein [Jannaschia sp. 2305UL9-9]|uniref:hypothetical protein n=1 Tax=Jannaschia sp. 2305UL9-9 TaxID=3121638 RepID=UPI003528999C
MELTTRHNGRTTTAPGAALRERAKELSRADDAAMIEAGRRAMDAYLERVTSVVAKRTRAGSEGQRRLEDYTVDTSDSEVTGTVTLTRGLGLQEYGGVMRVKNKRYLTVPLPAAMTGGKPKRMRARQWEDARVITSRKGNLIIARKQGRRWIPLYALEKEVHIRARLVLRREMKNARPDFMRDVGKEIKGLLAS